MRSVACVGLLAGPAAVGQDDGGEGEKQGEEQKWDDLPSTFAEGWERLQANYPGVMCGFSGARVSDIYGTPFGGGSTPEESVENFLKEYGGLFGLPREELVLTSSIVPGDGGPVYLYYAQIFGDTRVHNGAIVFTMQNQPGYAISHISSGLHPSPRPFLTDPKLSADEALAVVRDLFVESFEWSDALLTVDPRNALPDYVWQVDVRSLENDAEAYSLLISATSGELIEKHLATDHVTDFTVTVKGLQSEDQLRPPYTCDVDTIANAQKYMQVTLNGGSPGYTDANGEYKFIDVPNLFTIEAKLDSQYFELKDQGAGNPYNETLGTGPGGPSEILFDNVNPSRPDVRQHINVWRWLHAARDWVSGLDSSYPLGGKINVTCNSDATGGDSSYYSAPATMVFKGFIGNREICNGLALEDQQYSTIVCHEYGHHLHHTVFDPAEKTPSPPWEESIADALSSFVVQYPIIADDICNCDQLGQIGRDLTKSDEPWPWFNRDPHFNGIAMARAYWSMRSALNDEARSGKILLHSIRKLPEGVDRRIALHAVLVDDDTSVFSDGNSNIADGSPNYEKINEAFRRHGLATNNIAYKTFALTYESFVDPTPGNDFSIGVSVATLGPNLISNEPLKLRYRINGGTWSIVTMNGSGQTGPYSYTIPGGSRNGGDRVDWYIRAETVDANRRFVCSPLQAQFVFPGDVSGYTPEERAYYTAIWTAAPRVVALSDDLTNKPTNPPWAVDPDPDQGTTGDGFYHGVPNFEDFGEQPNADFPYDSDGVSIGKCYFTDKYLHHGVSDFEDGWTLTTKPFDLSQSGLDGAVVSYALWFYTRYGTNGRDRFRVSIDNGAGQITTLETIQVAGATCAARARYPWVRRRIRIPSTVQLTANMTLIFRVWGATSDLDCLPVPPKVEAAIDEVRVWGYHAN